MKHEEAVAFIRPALAIRILENWADLGCGSGTFTKALAELLPTGSSITAIDRENQQLNIPQVDFTRANFEKDDLKLTDLNGIMIANALHYVADKTSLIKKLEKLFKGSPKFLIIEYDTNRSNPWVPYPISFNQLKALFSELGYSQIAKINTRPSAYKSGEMYSALIT
jgi:trans-aconitate methyltransferase